MNAPHPSYPPLEMAASGAVVITTEYENKKNLDMYSENIFFCEYTLDSIVQAVNKYNNLSNSDIEKNYKNNKLMVDWDKSFEELLSIYNQIYRVYL